MSTPLILALDCGTQSTRALLVDLHGEVVAKSQVPLTDYRSPEDGWVEHDADAFWQASAQACRGLWTDHAALRDQVRGVVVTTQRGSLVPVDAQGKPLRPFIIWMDKRRASRPRRMPPWWQAAFTAARVSETISYFTQEAELNWIAEHQPQLHAQIHKVLLVSGWLNYKLTGKFIDSVGSQVGYLPFDFKRQRWAPSWDWKWHAVAIERHQLTDLAAVGERLGGLTAEAAAATGLPVGLPVLAGAADKACEVLGAGASQPHLGALSYGTAATIDITTPKYVEPLPFVPPYPAAMPGKFNTEVQIFRGFWMVSWFKEQFGHPEREAAPIEGLPPEALFDRLVAAVPPGSQGLMLQPYWSPGLRHPGPEARGAIIGFSDVHTRAHLYRAILEGLAFALREGLEHIQKRSGVPITSLRVSGGGSQSDAAMQLTADIFNLPAYRPHTPETSGLGAAIIGAVGLGLHPDYATAVAAMTRVGQGFTPNPDNAALYQRQYRLVYRKMYKRLQPLYQVMRGG